MSFNGSSCSVSFAYLHVYSRTYSRIRGEGGGFCLFNLRVTEEEHVGM